jgi:C-terminal processing protease CtpA/Prc
VFIGDDIKSTPHENFEYLWKTLDEKYSFFEYKNIDWNEVYVRYKSKIKDDMSEDQLFDVFFQMLAELKDAHVNLTSPFNITRYDEVFAKGPENYNNRLISDNYLLNNYGITGPFKHQAIAYGTIGYIRFESFSDDVSSSDINYVINKYKDLKGIIFDVRNNGGGYVENVFTLCRAFADQKRHVYTSYIKTGPGHEDFSGPHEVYLGPSGTIYSKPVCVLTNRSCYSATSFFVLAMKSFPNVTVVGDTTGGGLGAPTGAELPNGWSFRFSCTRTLSPQGINYENGIPPDVVKYLRTTDVSRGLDSIIEAAIRVINSKEKSGK